MGVVGRSVAGLALAVALTAALSWALSSGEESPEEAPRSTRVSEGKEVREFLLPPSVPRGEAWVVYLAAPGHELPARVAPVVAVERSGTIRLVRPAPPADSPEGGPWWAAGIQLPGESLRGLGPESRAALLALLHAWRGTLGRGTSWRAVTEGVTDPEELELLSRWER